MCLDITKESLAETEKLKAKGLPIVAYKILEPNMTSMYKGFQWQSGENVSDRDSAELTEDELKTMKIHKGFHFFLNQPEKCPYLNRYQCRYLCLCRYLCRYLSRYRCLSEKPASKVFKVEIKPENLIALGTWSDISSLAATQCTLLKEI